MSPEERQPGEAKHVIVVGAGIIGASIAWHLTTGGARVTIIDAGGAGGVATPSSFAWINASWGNPEPYFRLRVRAMAEWRRLADALPALPLAWTGGLCFDMPAPELEAYARQHGEWGYGIRCVEGEEALRIEPSLAEPPDFALHVAEEGAVEPQQAAELLLADAAQRGAHVMLKTPVDALVEKGGAVRGVVTAAGAVAADEVVLAAGAGTAALAETAGVSVPVTTPPGLLVQSRPHERLLNGLVMGPRLHMRQTADGRIVAGADFGGSDPGADAEDAAQTLFAEVKAMLRAADGLAFDFHTVGHRPTPADGFPIVGRPSGHDGLYLAVMHSGITLAAGVGRFVADEILAGRRDPLLAPYGPDRFA